MIQRPSCFHWKTQPITRANFFSATAVEAATPYDIMQVGAFGLEAGTYTLETMPTNSELDVLTNALASPTLYHRGTVVTHFWQETISSRQVK